MASLPPGLKPKPELDQNFMLDGKILDSMVAMARLSKKDTVLEIGAGTGLLTKRLAKKAGKVVAVEIDPDLKPYLQSATKGLNVDVRIGNALELMDSVRFNKVVSNIPYSISEPLVQKLMKSDFEEAVLTVPKAFAARLTATEGRLYSRLSLGFQSFFLLTDTLDIQKDCFNPRPKVNSVVIRFQRKPCDSLTCALILRDQMLVKNAIREALCEAKKMTKNEAREALKGIKLTSIEDKKVSELSVSELKRLIESVAGFTKVNK